MKERISIIIPTLNRPAQLIKLLEKIIHFDDEDEIIVVDDSMESLNKAIEANFGKKIKYKNRGKRLGVSSARNLGAELATSNYLLFLDDDDDFTDSWLNSFRSHIQKTPDLIFCNMISVEPNGKRHYVSTSDNSLGAMGDRIVIPGAWMVRRDFFLNLNGYDERLLFAENTEFFYRAFSEKPKVSYISEFNFIYHPCPTGGSKNLQNMVDSLSIILEKHSASLNDHVKHLYHQIIGVNHLRFRDFRKAQTHLWKAVKFKPSKPSTWGRWGISLFPFIARGLYSETVDHG
ncbi:glycosyltransferase family 2 protein [Algoriphagus sediminis]|uniref:Glycosyltransferase n=1 Tax=Algoriphagus sediminis TaxID=3057113 RepID=A0ABT7YDT1_9BACT|nr:glycosyltransferase [Algoriphagus sediminis]MDN3204693.1 glycosyltransferase [Algoriphagus sediminis]